MIWFSKTPPIYCFHNDYWLREIDKLLFMINCDTARFESRVEKIEFGKRQKRIYL